MKKLLSLALFVVLLMAVFAMPAQAADDNYYMMLVNKEHMVSYSYVPENLVSLGPYMPGGSSQQMTAEAARAMGEMVAAAKADGVTSMYASSGYRSYSTQTYLYERKINYYRGLGYNEATAVQLAGTVVAPPGSSEHQTGMALDITTAGNDYSMTGSFADTRAGRWLAEHCWEYGYVLRYPEDKTEITGYIYEPWHFRYVGKPHAEYMTKNNLCLEEYMALLEKQGVVSFTDASGTAWAVYLRPYNDSADLPCQVVATSAAYPANAACVVTGYAPDEQLFDLIGHWSEEEVRRLVDYGIILGYPDNTFQPDREISRAELMVLLDRVWTLLEESGYVDEDDLTPPEDATLPEEELPEEDIFADDSDPDAIGSDAVLDPDAAETTPVTVTSRFRDVETWRYYYSALDAAYSRGLLAGSMIAEVDGHKYFSPAASVLRREVALCMAPLFPVQHNTPTELPFSDLEMESEEVQQAVALLTGADVVRGNNGAFRGEDILTRAEVSALLIRVIDYYTN